MIKRYTSFCLFFDENFNFTTKEESSARRFVLKILNVLVAQEYISRKLTYEYDKELKSIYIYTFESKLNLKFNLHHLKVNLIIPTIFINKQTPYTRNLSYLSVNKVMLLSEGSLKEFKLKDLNLLHELFSTKYIFDVAYYHKIYELILENTPAALLESGEDWR